MEVFSLLGMIWAGMILIEILSTWTEQKRNKEQLVEKLDRTIRVIELESLPDQKGLILAYDAENNQFLGQGFTVEEIKQNVMARFPERIFLLNDKAFSALPNFKAIIK